MRNTAQRIELDYLNVHLIAHSQWIQKAVGQHTKIYKSSIDLYADL